MYWVFVYVPGIVLGIFPGANLQNAQRILVTKQLWGLIEEKSIENFLVWGTRLFIK